MRYPNLRYGNPTAMQHYAMWYGDTATLARSLRRDERTVKDWLAGRARVPWWVPEIMRMQQAEHAAMVYRMTGRQVAVRLGVVDGPTIVDAGQRFRPEIAYPIQEVFDVKKAQG